MEVRFVQNLMAFGIFLKLCEMSWCEFVRFFGFERRELWAWSGGKGKRSHA